MRYRFAPLLAMLFTCTTSASLVTLEFEVSNFNVYNEGTLYSDVFDSQFIINDSLSVFATINPKSTPTRVLSEANNGRKHIFECCDTNVTTNSPFLSSLESITPPYTTPGETIEGSSLIYQEYLFDYRYGVDSYDLFGSVSQGIGYYSYQLIEGDMESGDYSIYDFDYSFGVGINRKVRLDPDDAAFSENVSAEKTLNLLSSGEVEFRMDALAVVSTSNFQNFEKVSGSMRHASELMIRGSGELVNTTYTTPTKVTEPGLLMLFSSAFAFMCIRRRSYALRRIDETTLL